MRDQWNKFIEKYIETQDHITAYQHAYPRSTRKTAATKGKALLKKDDVWMRVNQANVTRAKLIEATKVRNVMEVITGADILTELEMDLLLSRMAAGEIEEERVIIIAGIATKVKVKPDINSRINAMDKLYRRKGAYMSDRNNPRNPKPLTNTHSIEELQQILDQNLKLLNE